MARENWDPEMLRFTEMMEARAAAQRPLEQARGAHLLLLVVDASAEPPTLPAELLALLDPARTLVVANKADLPAHPAQRDFLPAFPKLSACLLDGRDAEALRAKLGEFLVAQEIAPGAEDLVVGVRHAEAMARAAEWHAASR